MTSDQVGQLAVPHVLKSVDHRGFNLVGSPLVVEVTSNDLDNDLVPRAMDLTNHVELRAECRACRRDGRSSVFICPVSDSFADVEHDVRDRVSKRVHVPTELLSDPV